MKYSVVTFGCRVNQADSLAIEEELLAAGATPAAPENADVVVVNTCSVTGAADQGARQIARRLARANPGVRVIVTGCYATRRAEEVGALPNVAAVVANDEKPRLLQIVKRATVEADDCGLWTADRFGDGDGSCGARIEPGVAGRTAFTLRLQTGCSEPCAYCIIPSTRGAPRSLSIDRVVREIDRIAAAGFKEIVLTGVHLGSYGRDLSPRSSLLDLLVALQRAAERQHEPVLFRISSLEPMDCAPEIVELVSRSDVWAPHFHLPLQHASNRILRAMRRPYTSDYYASLVDGIRFRRPDASIGTDVIAGFPGETDDDFEELATYLERSPLTHVHVFPYSDRPGTAAAAMEGKVHGAAIRERARRLRDIGQRLAARFRDAQVGTTHRALTLGDGTLAVTGNYLKIEIPTGRTRNEWVRVRVTSHHQGELLAC